MCLQVSGDITYNGEGFDSFQVARTSAYISQVDEHQAELTVRETFDFAARCLGVGHKQGMPLSPLAAASSSLSEAIL
jgi:ABC-type multidrug transport system ATPase subunit